MKKRLLIILITVVSFFGETKAQVFRPMTIRYNNASVKGNIVYVSNNSVTTPGAITTEAPPGGTATNNGRPGAYLDIDVDVPAHTVKIPFNSVWNYHSNGAVPANNPAAENWTKTAYIIGPPFWNLGAIPVNGPGKYGYRNPVDPSIATCIKSSAAATLCAPVVGAKYTAYYFRKTVNFTAMELAAYSTLLVNMKRNDGAVVYVNGVERLRTNMPGGVIGYGTLAIANITPGATEDYNFNLDPAFFMAGANTIAVEIHTQLANATDMSFDMQMLGIDKNSSFSSTSADLNLNSCSQVLWAGLYWGANHQSGTTSDTAWIKQEKNVKLKLPGSASYQMITSSQTDYHNSGRLAGLNHAGYFCFADITSLINLSNANGTYTVADIVAPVGFNSCGGGWTLAIAYANSTESQRNITIFDGSAVVKVGSPDLFVPISGFLTPPVGPVSCELGVVAYDGDRGSPGLLDNFYFKQDSNPAVGVYTNMTPNATSNLNDMFNSTISNKGVVSMARNPAHLNTLGYDADIIEIPNAGNVLLGNGQNSASIRLSSTVEDFFIQLITTSVSIYNPTFAFNKSASDINGGSMAPGDSIRYQVNYRNVGNDASTNTVIIDNIPVGTSYLPNSLRINGISKTDAAGDDQAEYDVINNRVIFRVGTGANAITGGNIATSGAGNVVFDVMAASSCRILSCVGTINNKASISYTGVTSGSSLVDTSGVDISGCIIAPLAVTSTPVGVCYTPADTLIINRCPVTSSLIPRRRYAGYTFYSAMPFIPANIYDPAIPVTSTRVYWAYFSNGPGCSDTVRIIMIITPCPDIDDDNDGIPDYVEFNNILATQDINGNGIPNWNDPTYLGYVDNNTDNVNDNFDWGADSDNDGISNFRDNTFWIPWVDVNGDGINDMSDRDLDGLPNQYDLDSDNDGIPDTVESYGVDTDGDGKIDNYTDTDNDGFTQNVDANITGVSGSNVGLGAQDLDGDGIPNYLDADSDNDGIPDIAEAGGSDTDNDGMVASFTDTDGDGYFDPVDGDVGNDLVAENASNTLLRTGADLGPIDGRADNYPYRNMDNDRRSNPYDLDSDGDGIADVLEAGFVDANYDGFIDGAIGADGWNIAVNALGSLVLINTDGRGNPNYMDIDSDDDGIPDNIEGQTTVGYRFPAYADTDNDGLDNSYDATVGFGGSGIFLSDKDGDNLPDYRDLDTDADGVPDIVEGNDFNRNGIADDNVTLTLLDTDGDGLDNRFDSLTSTINIKGTSYNLGNGGIPAGDPAPGSRSPVQKTNAIYPDRDWRYVGYVLNVQLLEFSGTSQVSSAVLNWGIITPVNLSRFEIERSTDNMVFEKVATVSGNISLNELHNFTANDDISHVNSQLIYYRLKVVASNGQVKFSNVIVIRKNINKTQVIVQPNPAANNTSIHFYAEKESEVTIRLIDAVGKTVLFRKQKVFKGNIALSLNDLSKFSNAVYSLQLMINNEVITQKLIIQNK